MFTPVDIARWPRKATFEFFKNYDDPFFNITAPVDVTQLRRRSKAAGESFFLNSLYWATRAANEMEAFRLRLLDGQLVRYDTVHAGSTVLMPDQTFRFCYFDYCADRPEFLQKGRLRIAALRENPALEPRDEAFDLIHFSVIPWVAFTAFKHARRWGVADTVPKIVFGKYYEQAGRWWMPLSVEVHHAMMDGYEVGGYFEKLEALLA